jgi:thioredoxin 2
MGASRLDRKGVIVPCPQCGRANRIAFTALDKTTRCGQCHTAIGAPDSPVEVDDAAAFDAAATGPLPLIVDFWAPWCGPCRMVAPELERVARSTAGQYLVVKVNTDQQTELASRFRIRSIPTLALIVNGQEIDRFAGARPAQEIEAFAARALAAHHRRAS